MKDLNFKAILPYITALLVFAVISILYFSPDILEGKILFQADTQQGIAIGQEAKAFKEATGETTRWTNSLFSGMPTYQSAPSYATRGPLKAIEKIYTLFLPSPVSYVYMMMLGFFILMLSLKVRKDIAILGSIIFAFSSYFFILIEAGHIWKYTTLAYIPPTIAGIILTYRGKYLLGGALTAFFATYQIASNHIQMSYYFVLFFIIFYAAGVFIEKYKEKRIIDFVKSSAVLVAAAALAICVNISNIYHTYQYSKETMRGGSEVSQTSAPGERTHGLEKDYITQWSYGVSETFSLLIPNIKGGGTAQLASNKTAFEKARPEFRQYFSQMNQYWGDQPFTSGPVYAGALVMFLFVLGLFIIKGWFKWVLVISTIFSVALAWGHNFMFLTDIFIDYMPLYNKFRAVSSLLVVAEFTIPVLAVMALCKIAEDPSILKTNIKEVGIAAGLTAGISLLFAILPDLFFSFMSNMETQQYLPMAAKDPNMRALFDNIEEGRKAIFTADAFRSFIIIMLGLGAMFLCAYKKISASVMVIIVTVICLGDMWSVDKRYLNSSKFVADTKKETPFKPTQADIDILKDKDPNFRVLNLTTNTFNDAVTSYFHKSIGGYHAAKLQRYQDIIDTYLSKNINPRIINMLNGKYIIQLNSQEQPQAMINPAAMGNAWFVSKIDVVNDARTELKDVGEIDLKTTAVVDKRFDKYISDDSFEVNPEANIRLTSYSPNELKYVSDNMSKGLAVFSEIYYPGWTATIDGKETEIIRANYILRAIEIPAGKHEIVMTFKPTSIKVTDTISVIALIIIGLLLLGALVMALKNRK